MKKIEICGGRKLFGDVRVHGAKNSVLPILAAATLNSGVSVIHDCPSLKDVKSAFNILRSLGAKVEYIDKTAYINSENVDGYSISENLMREMRSSVIFLGAIISRQRNAIVSLPGGCELGPRPIDLHIDAFRQMGVEIEEQGGYISCSLDKLRPSKIMLKFPSVGATENIMLLAAVSDVETIIVNSAREPEIVDLQNFLNNMGADISGAGSNVIRIVGVEKLHSAEHAVIPDRIVGITYLCAVAACGGDAVIRNVVPEHIAPALKILSECGCEITEYVNSIRIKRNSRLKCVNLIETKPYPGFPTDAQALIMPVLCQADGDSRIIENLFDSRFKHADELCRMGANIRCVGKEAFIKGVNGLYGRSVISKDLRGGAALVIAGLSAEGITNISGVDHIDRGYENIESDFVSLGANIRRVEIDYSQLGIEYMVL